jgi:peptidoglycan LD-endopeptidase LytH
MMLKSKFKWRGIDQELTPRSVRLLIIAVLLGFGSASNGFAPVEPSASMAGTLMTADSARTDSLMRLIGLPPELRSMRSLSRRSYRRSSQIERAIAELRERDLLLPVAGIAEADLHDSFNDARGDGSRRHNAIDIHAPRGTPILSVDDGTIIKLHNSNAGGISVYATDPRTHFIYFYGHLEKYHEGIREGMPIARGDTLGYVGTSGNAPPNTPHLHFQILRASNVARWSRGTPINPVKVLK